MNENDFNSYKDICEDALNVFSASLTENNFNQKKFTMGRFIFSKRLLCNKV